MTIKSRKRVSSRIVGGSLWAIALVCIAAAIKSEQQGIVDLASDGNLAAVKVRVEQNPALVHRRTEHGRTPLHAAVSQCHGDIIDYLIAQGANVNVRDDLGETPLHKAARSPAHLTPSGGCPKVIDDLIAQGAKVNAQNDQGETPLHIAASSGSPKAVKHLLDHGADVNIRSHTQGKHPLGNLPLHLAVMMYFGHDEETWPREKKAHLKIVKLLVAAGTDVNARTKGLLKTPLHFAAKSNLPRAIKYLVEHGAKLEARDAGGRTPLLIAAFTSEGSLAAFKMLIHLGADPTVRTIDDIDDESVDLGSNALSFAAMQGHLEMVKILIEKGVPAKYDPRQFESSETPIYTSALSDAIQFSHFALGEADEQQEFADQLAVIDLLAEYMGGINAGVKVEGFNGTALEFAVRSGEPFVVRHILENYPKSYAREDIKASIANLIENGVLEPRHPGERETDDAEKLEMLREALAAGGGTDRGED